MKVKVLYLLHCLTFNRCLNELHAGAREERRDRKGVTYNVKHRISIEKIRRVKSDLKKRSWEEKKNRESTGYIYMVQKLKVPFGIIIFVTQLFTTKINVAMVSTYEKRWLPFWKRHLQNNYTRLKDWETHNLFDASNGKFNSCFACMLDKITTMDEPTLSHC